LDHRGLSLPDFTAFSADGFKEHLMQKWETTFGGPMVGENVLGYCNRMGKQGWEPFHIEAPQVYEGGRATVYFKRPVAE